MVVAALAAGGCSDGTSSVPPSTSTGINCAPRSMFVPLASARPPSGDAAVSDVAERDAAVSDVAESDAAVSDAAVSDADVCASLCPAQPEGAPAWYALRGCEAATVDGGAGTMCHYEAFCPGGRETAGVHTGAPAGRSAGELLAAMASLEHGAVHAFRRLARELAAHGAPASLQRAARRAIPEERRHARAMQGLAARYGATARRPSRAGAAAARDLEAFARENAVEGCVRETWGATLAAWQAARAHDPAVREAFAVIARDEARHADLAWRIARWADGVLPVDARDRVRAARHEAATALRAAARHEGLDDPQGRIGWPTRGPRAAMADVIAAHIARA